MTDYIKREDAIQAFEPKQRRDWYTPWIVETLEGLPSADVVPMERYKSMENTCVKLQKSLADVAPVRHGRWVVIDAEEPRRYGCSECKRLSWNMENYCGNCGAKMNEEENDGNQ